MKRALRLLVIPLVLFTCRAHACGGGGVTSAAGVVMDAQRIVISARSSGTTDVVVQITVPKTNADYAVLIPVPSQPTLDTEPVSSDELGALADETAPQIETASESSGGSGCACIGASSKGGSGANIKGVSTSELVEVGPVTAVALTADDSAALAQWLNDNGFKVPTAQSALIDEYLGAGRYFIAAKRSDKATTGAPSSVGLHYSLQGDHRQISLRFARLGAAEEVSYTLFVVGPKALAPAEPFAALTLDDLDADALRLGSYAQAVSDAIAAHDGRAFVLESVTDAKSFSSFPTLGKLFDTESVITRASSVIARAALTEDAQFTRSFAGSVPQHRWLSMSAKDASMAGYAFAGAAFMSLVLRRRSPHLR
ncbi:MAG TPA: DUF2330 domain-containing protein [Polyangiaceae bacterium]|nr:DUF2330 domain-containing protein [Polyangiaceae bacterium]